MHNFPRDNKNETPYNSHESGINVITETSFILFPSVFFSQQILPEPCNKCAVSAQKKIGTILLKPNNLNA